MIECGICKINTKDFIVLKISYLLLLLLPFLLLGCCCQTCAYQNVPEGPRMKGLVATRNAPSATRSSEGLRLKGLPYSTDNPEE